METQVNNNPNELIVDMEEIIEDESLNKNVNSIEKNENNNDTDDKNINSNSINSIPNNNDSNDINNIEKESQIEQTNDNKLNEDNKNNEKSPTKNLLNNEVLRNAFNLSEDEESSEEESKSVKEKDEEPKLKYQIIIGSLPELLKKDAISTITVSDRFLAVGTHWGMIHLLDLTGNSVKRFKSHSATVNEISIDDNGEYIASASDDGRVVINGLYSPDANTFTYKRPIKAISLEPNFSRKSSRQFISGGTAEQLILNGKGWFGNRDTILFSGEGPIYSVKWIDSYIAWSNDFGINIYDISTQSKIGYIERSKKSPRADLFKCNLYWKSNTVLICGWADNVKICEVKEGVRNDTLTSSTQKYVEVIHEFQTEYIVSGIATLDDTLIIVAFLTDKKELENIDVLTDTPKKRKISKPPEIRVTDYFGNELAADVISVQGFEKFKANDYHLEHIIAENTYYISSPKTIIMAKPRDLKDHIDWLLERQRYEEALNMVEKADESYGGRTVHDIVDIGQKYMKSLVKEGRYTEAAMICPKILRQNGELWEEWILLFSNSEKLSEIIPYIPSSNPQLNPSIYELILSFLLENNIKKFYSKIELWPSNIYNISEIIILVEAELEKKPKNEILMSALADLYTYNKQYDMTLSYYLQLYRPNALDLIKKHNLYSMLEPLVVLLMKYDEHFVDSDLLAYSLAPEKSSSSSSINNINNEDSTMSSITDDKQNNDIFLTKEDIVMVKDNNYTPLQRVRAASKGAAVNILIENTDRILISQVVDQLYTYPKYLHIYLDALLQKDFHEGYDYHKLQIELYAEYDYPRLLPFLRTSTYYSLESAYEVCERRDLVPEMVYLLGQMGNNKQALNLIISRLGDVKRAIEFAQQQNDPDLWEDLINYSMDKPKFIVGLLENVGSYIDPIKLIRRIPEKMEIPGLKNTLVKVMKDYNVQMSLREGCEKILISDTIELFEQLYNAQRRGMLFEETIECSICNNEIVNDLTESPDSIIIVFFCRHWFHERCLQSSQNVAYLMNSKAIKMENNQEISRNQVLTKAIEAVYFPVKLNLNSSLLNQFSRDSTAASASASAATNINLFSGSNKKNIQTGKVITSGTSYSSNNDSVASGSRRSTRVIKPVFRDSHNSAMSNTDSDVANAAADVEIINQIGGTTTTLTDGLNPKYYEKKGLYCFICQSSTLQNHSRVTNNINIIDCSNSGSTHEIERTGTISQTNHRHDGLKPSLTLSTLSTTTPYNRQNTKPKLSTRMFSQSQLPAQAQNNNNDNELTVSELDNQKKLKRGNTHWI